jgi:tRNA-Thr(GGU) m(6)t(6)A37 methyltransferase TsaA
MFQVEKIGTIRTPYQDRAPYQPDESAQGEFRIILNPEYVPGLYRLESYRYIYVIYYMDRSPRKASMTAKPPWAGGLEVGLFASRSPARPNPIGLSVVRLLKIVRNEIFTSGIDALDGTPVLDIKPYVKRLDAKPDANNGWGEELCRFGAVAEGDNNDS